MDMIGKIHPSSSKRHLFILVQLTTLPNGSRMDLYMVNVTQEDMIHFIQYQIICQLGIPQTNTIDQGSEGMMLQGKRLWH